VSSPANPILNSGGEGQDQLFDPLVPYTPEPVAPQKALLAEPLMGAQEEAPPEVAPAPEQAGLLTDFHPENLAQVTASMDRLFASFGDVSQDPSHWLGGLSPLLVGMVLGSAAVELARRQRGAGRGDDIKEMGSPWYPLSRAV
jgi:hypothetical protein